MLLSMKSEASSNFLVLRFKLEPASISDFDKEIMTLYVQKCNNNSIKNQHYRDEINGRTTHRIKIPKIQKANNVLSRNLLPAIVCL